MKIVNWNPEEKSFFITASFQEFDVLSEQYSFKRGTTSVAALHNRWEEHHQPGDGYYEMVKEVYGIDYDPEVCFSVNTELTDFYLHAAHMPFANHWDGYSPWKMAPQIKEIVSLDELKPLFEEWSTARQKSTIKYEI